MSDGTKGEAQPRADFGENRGDVRVLCVRGMGLRLGAQERIGME